MKESNYTTTSPTIKEPSALAEEIEQLSPIIDQLTAISKSVDRLKAVSGLFYKPESEVGEATKQLMAGLGHIEDALHCLKYGPEWSRNGRTCIGTAAAEAE